MPAGADQLQPPAQLQLPPLPEPDARVRPHHPGPLRLVQVDRRPAERPAPFHHRRVIMRVRDRDLGDPAQLLHLLNRRVVQEPDAVPQDVAALRLDQERPLADPELRLGVDRVEPVLLLLDDIPVRRPQVLERRPLLAVGVDVLPLVLADGTSRRGLIRLGELRPAGDAEIRRALAGPVCRVGGTRRRREGRQRGGRSGAVLHEHASRPLSCHDRPSARDP